MYRNSGWRLWEIASVKGLWVLLAEGVSRGARLCETREMPTGIDIPRLSSCPFSRSVKRSTNVNSGLAWARHWAVGGGGWRGVKHSPCSQPPEEHWPTSPSSASWARADFQSPSHEGNGFDHF